VVLLAIALTACAVSARAADVPERVANPKLSQAAARASALKDLKKLVRFAQRPADTSIVALSRQFGFTYTVDECHPTEDADDWCWYEARYSRPPAAGLSSVGFGTDKRSGQPTARLLLDVIDPRVCLSPVEVEKVLGPGKHFATPIPHLAPGQPLPPIKRGFVYRAIPGGGALSVDAHYSGPCLSLVLIDF
jgi:hypothetical protein